MRFTKNDHTFVICAYQENPYLEKCIQSILAQTVFSRVIMTTATPNDHIRRLSEAYSIPLTVNPIHEGQAADLNFGYAAASTPLVTLCHQDDYYHPDYLKETLASIGPRQTPILIFSDYEEDRAGKLTHDNRLMRIKLLMLAPLRVRPLQGSRFVRRRILAFGDPICCPAVTFHKNVLPEKLFRSSHNRCPDWDAWERFSRLKGDFIYCPRRLVYHRIWPGSITTACVEDGSRTKEELEIFERFWPRPIARRLSGLYNGAQKSNSSDTK